LGRDKRSEGVGVSVGETVVWVAVAALAVVLLLMRDGPRLTNDSYQYLSAAENIADHQALTTSIVHYDTERKAIACRRR
jgi:hypothetical protein